MIWTPTEWTRQADLNSHEPCPIVINRMCSPFYQGVRFAVRCRKRCLSVKGVWEFEPLPSSRTDSFYGLFRFESFESARLAAEKAGLP